MALVLAAALLPLPRAAAQAAGTDLTPEELIRTAQRAYEAADWVQAEALFGSLIQTYATTPELVETVRRARPLLVTTRLRQKKYDEETVSLLGEVLADPRLDPVAADELAFWRGLCHVQTGAFAEARAALSDYYAGKAPGADALPEPARRVRAGRRAESVLLHAACLLQENSPAEAAVFLAPHIPVLREHNQLEAAGRAVVLRLHALLAANDETAAVALVRDTQPRLGEITQVVAFHTLCLQLGSRLLETGRHHDAIACLQRVWPRDQILAHQRSSQTHFTKRLEQARRSPGQEALVFQLEGLVKRLQRETEQFSTTETFDSALRLRVAAAYRELGRHREAALVLENMLARLPPDPVVEKAALSLIQSWMQVERWPRAVAAADAFLEQFNRPGHADVPMVRFLKASALHADRRPHEAELAFAGVHQLHQDHDLAPRALFLEGICLLEQDLHREALDAFAETAKRYPKSDVLEDCDYWAGMALSFDKRHAEARDRMRTHLTEYRDRGRHATEARFRIAFSTFGLAEYPEAVAELRPFIAAHPGSPLAEEAKLLLGDALGALGRIDDAVAAYRSVDRSTNARFHEEAIFRIGNAYKVSEQPDALRAHFEGFMADHPSSQRLAEAVYWIGQSHQQAGRPEAARQAYWDVLATHGDTATSHGIEDILTSLPRLYPGEAGREELIAKLQTLAAATLDTKPTLTLRARWARAQVLAKSEPERARADLVDARPLLAPRHHHPRLIADCADALRESGRSQDARTLYRELRKWHPRALEKDRAFLGLGLLALEEHQPADALALFARFEQETLGSPLLGEVARLKAGIFENQGQLDQAQAEQERLLEMPMVPRQLKARTLLKLGDLMARQGEDLKSTAYYERVYVSYGKYLPEVATAYLKRATALERLDHTAAAMDVWRELAGRTDLATLPEAVEARRRLDELDPGWHDRIQPASSTAAIPPSPAPPPSS